jgi:hypothetical protein
VAVHRPVHVGGERDAVARVVVAGGGAVRQPGNGPVADLGDRLPDVGQLTKGQEMPSRQYSISIGMAEHTCNSEDDAHTPVPRCLRIREERVRQLRLYDPFHVFATPSEDRTR